MVIKTSKEKFKEWVDLKRYVVFEHGEGKGVLNTLIVTAKKKSNEIDRLEMRNFTTALLEIVLIDGKKVYRFRNKKRTL